MSYVEDLRSSVPEKYIFNPEVTLVVPSDQTKNVKTVDLHSVQPNLFDSVSCVAARLVESSHEKKGKRVPTLLGIFSYLEYDRKFHTINFVFSTATIGRVALKRIYYNGKAVSKA